MDISITTAIESLKHNGVILYPTDTIWGIGCDATNPDACKKLISIKPREASKSFLILVSSVVMLEKYVAGVPEIAYQLIEVATSPLTIIYPQAINLPPEVTAPDGSIGIRLVKSGFCSTLINTFRKPLVSTSANFPGESAPKFYCDINKALIQKVDYKVEREKELGSTHKESDIIKLFRDGSFKIIR